MRIVGAVTCVIAAAVLTSCGTDSAPTSTSGGGTTAATESNPVGTSIPPALAGRWIKQFSFTSVDGAIKDANASDRDDTTTVTATETTSSERAPVVWSVINEMTIDATGSVTMDIGASIGTDRCTANARAVADQFVELHDLACENGTFAVAPMSGNFFTEGDCLRIVTPGGEGYGALKTTWVSATAEAGVGCPQGDFDAE